MKQRKQLSILPLFGDQHNGFLALSCAEVTRISTDALVDSLLEQDNIDDTNTASASATVQQNGLDTDGKGSFPVEILTVLSSSPCLHQSLHTGKELRIAQLIILSAKTVLRSCTVFGTREHKVNCGWSVPIQIISSMV